MREISPAAVQHIDSASERVREAYELIADMTALGIQACVSKRQGVFAIDKEKFLQLHKTVQGYVVMEVLAQAGGSRKDLEAVHVRQVRGLFHSQCGREILLPHGLRARRDYTGIPSFSIYIKRRCCRNMSSQRTGADGLRRGRNSNFCLETGRFSGQKSFSGKLWVRS